MSRAVISLKTAMFLLLFPLPLFAAEVESRRTDVLLFENLGTDLLGPRLRDSKVLQALSLDAHQGDDAKEDRLAEVVQHMQAARSVLEQQDETREASSAQSRAIDGLDAMIAELARRQSQCRGGQSKQSSQPKPGASKPGTSPATGASPTISRSGDLAASLAATGELVKDLWGHLPERQRQQILQPLSEDFLPKYATEIEEYFRALADPDRRPPESP